MITFCCSISHDPLHVSYKSINCLIFLAAQSIPASQSSSTRDYQIINPPSVVESLIAKTSRFEIDGWLWLINEKFTPHQTKPSRCLFTVPSFRWRVKITKYKKINIVTRRPTLRILHCSMESCSYINYTTRANRFHYRTWTNWNQLELV